MDVDYERDLDDIRSTIGYVQSWWRTYLLVVNGTIPSCIMYHQVRVYGSS